MSDTHTGKCKNCKKETDLIYGLCEDCQLEEMRAQERETEGGENEGRR